MEHLIRVTAEVSLENEEEVRALITRCALGALEREKVDFAAFVDVTIVDDENIRALNAEYREKDAVTDVLSFPMYEFLNGEPQEDLEPDPESGRVMLGDMILNYERARQQAAEFGHSAARECGFLTVHSVLHLLGFDHERDETDRALMRGEEEVILDALGLTRESV
ncbi:MAG: rRNA maturation RNase YbeY [Butyricicoccus sp.]|nr:rRNA maturation RNase YbeY [Butyricicoccus sp.]